MLNKKLFKQQRINNLMGKKNFLEFKLIVISLIIFVTLLMPSVLALHSLGTFKQNECINLIQTCANCSFVNLTLIAKPDSSTILLNEEMTKQGTIYNYTFCDNDLIGSYSYWTLGNIDGEVVTAGVNYIITKTGMKLEQSETIPLLLPLIMILLTSGFSLFLAFKINVDGLKTILIGFAGVLILFSIIYSLNIVNDILAGFESITGGYVLFYRIIVMTTWVVFISWTIYLLFVAVDKIKRIRGMK